MSTINFMLSSVEHEKDFIASGPRLTITEVYNFGIRKHKPIYCRKENTFSRMLLNDIKLQVNGFLIK